MGHRRQRPGHGVRQYGRGLRHRRRLHPQSLHRRNAFYGEYLVNAQGEDVVAGIRTPQHLTIAGKQANKSDLPSMEEVMPEVFQQLDAVRLRLEGHYRDMQDIEFTVQQNKLYMLQTRTGKRTAAAALKISVDLAAEA